MIEWKDRKVLIIGAARQGVALARYLSMRGAKVVLNDIRTAKELTSAQKTLDDFPIEWVFGGHPLDLLDSIDLVCPSGGIPLTLPIVVEARRRGITLSNDSQIFLEATPCPVVGVTGSAGKTTTTTLISKMIKSEVDIFQEGIQQHTTATSLAKWSLKDSSKIWLGGNIGVPLISLIDNMQKDDIAIMELSSFQLELMTISPQVAVVLNITPNHLDRHQTMDRYLSAKARILEFQSAKDWGVLNREDWGSWKMTEIARGSLISFGIEEHFSGHNGVFLRDQEIIFRDIDGNESNLISKEDILLRGDHNLLNVMASCAVGRAIGISNDAMRSGLGGFEGIPHRLEFVRSWGGGRWFNDSIATAPDRTIAAIRSFDEPIILLAGGKDKDLPWNEFASVVRQRVKHLILFGESSKKILHSLSEDVEKDGSKQNSWCEVTLCKNLREAVELASKVVFPGSVVLLSPGGTSYDEFRDFEDRGEAFKRCVMQLQ